MKTDELSSLIKEQKHKLRLLQKNTFPHLPKLYAIDPNLYGSISTHCKDISTLYHMVWACKKKKKKRRTFAQSLRVLASSSSEKLNFGWWNVRRRQQAPTGS